MITTTMRLENTKPLWLTCHFLRACIRTGVAHMLGLERFLRLSNHMLNGAAVRMRVRFPDGRTANLRPNFQFTVRSMAT